MARFDCAEWKPISANTGGAMASQRGLLMHQQVGNGELTGFFSNPAAQVSAQFQVMKDGRVLQFVDSEIVAWHARDLNADYCGAEFEGFPEEPLTAGQVSGGARLFAEGHARHGWPLTEANAKGEHGFGFHRMPGSANGPGGQYPTACPSDLRLSARPAILQAAADLGSGTYTPGGPPPPSSSGGGPVGGGAVEAPPFPGRLLALEHPNMRGEDVATWQRRMLERGWSLGPWGADGVYGEASADACVGFQADKGLTVDGIVGPVTWEATWEAPIT